MKPKRPDSAKSAATRKTLDSDGLQKDLNTSKFSETFSTGVRQEDNFKQYIAEKEKDPKFKKYKQQSKLEEIPEQTKPKQSSRLASKPFEKKINSKIEKATQKIEEPPKQTIQPTTQEQMNKSKGFAQRNKEKMNTLKIQPQNKVNQSKQKPKPKINFNAFTVNVPGKPKQPKKQQIKKQSPVKQQSNTLINYGQLKKKPLKSKQQLERQEQMQELSAFIQTVEAKNINNYPARYDEFIEKSECSDLDKINLNDFLIEPTEEDYNKMKRRIQKFDQKLKSQENESVIEEEITQKTSEIDLDQLIESSADQESQIFLSSISAQDLKKRNLFLTEILKGKITKQQIQQMEEMDKSAIKLKKLQQFQQKDEEEEDQIQMVEINMMKKKSNRLIERNKIQASGQIYRDCDYLSEEHKKRLQQLLSGEDASSPFDYSEIDQMRNRRIDEGIIMYRQLSHCIDNSGTNQIIIREESLPRDPHSRKQAEQRILKQKVKNINQKLLSLDKLIVNKEKIDSIVKEFEGTKLSSMTQSYLQQKNKQFEETTQKLAEAEQIIIQSMKQKETLIRTLKEMEDRFKQLEDEVNHMFQMDERQFRQMELNQMKNKMKEVESIEHLTQEIGEEIRSFQLFNADMRQKLRVLDEIDSLNVNRLQYENYKENESIDDLDKMITMRWELGESKFDEDESQ